MHWTKPQKAMTLMEICGTHTMAIARSGIKSLLPEGVHLISGPGCPVCVTPSSVIDQALVLAQDPRNILCSYGDLLRIPGSHHTSLRGLENVKLCLSPMDALDLAQNHPDKQVIFLGVGFETTAPGSAILIKEAYTRGIKNFSFLSLLKRTEPALCSILESEGQKIDGFLIPGHVATIIGEDGFRFLSQNYHRPGVVCGFEPEDILVSIDLLIQDINEGSASIQNTYARLVKPEGNLKALECIKEVFEVEDALWRGLGYLPDSGYRLKEKFSFLDAKLRFSIPDFSNKEPKGCRCADVICGKIDPKDCPLFKNRCTPQDPVGPCMVSSEGSCGAAYQYEE